MDIFKGYVILGKGGYRSACLDCGQYHWKKSERKKTTRRIARRKLKKDLKKQV